MKTYRNKLLFFLLFLLTFSSISSFSQTKISSGFLPKINILSQLSEKTKLTSSIESRQLFFENTNVNKWSFDYVLTDLTGILSFNLTNQNKLNVGYTLRINDNQLFHRFIQQFSILQNLDNIRLAHRFGIDQTFTNQSSFVFRTRYRAVIEKPLNGNRIDVKEFYLKLGNEYLWSINRGESDIQIRFIPQIGYEIDKENNIEFGVDYRISKFINDNTQNNFWFRITWYTKLKRKS